MRQIRAGQPRARTEPGPGRRQRDLPGSRRPPA